MKDLRVLVIPSWYPSRERPGSGIFFKEQTQSLVRAGVRAGVVYSDFRSLRTLSKGALGKNFGSVRFDEEDGIPTARFQVWNIPNRGRLRAKLWVRATRRLASKYVSWMGRPDLLHAHSILWGGVAAWRIAETLDLPFVITEHSTGYARGLIRTWEARHVRETAEAADSLVAVSSGLKRILGDYVADVPIEVIPNVVDTEFFKLPPEPRGIEPYTILTVATLHPKKAIDVLIEAFSRSASECPRAVLEIGGDGAIRGELESRARATGCGDRVRFLGPMSRSEVRDALWRANVFVLPSRVETFGVVLIEAMATGLSVIATRSGGPEDIVTGRTGTLVEPDDTDGLAQALVSAYKNSESLRLREADIRAYATGRFGPKAVTDSLIELYQRVLGRDATS